MYAGKKISTDVPAGCELKVGGVIGWVAGRGRADSGRGGQRNGEQKKKKTEFEPKYKESSDGVAILRDFRFLAFSTFKMTLKFKFELIRPT